MVALVAGLWRPVRAMRHDRAAARHAGVLLPALASDLLSAVELASPDTPDPRAAAVSARLMQAFQDYVAGSVGAVDARQLVPLRPAGRAVAAGVAAIAAVIAAVALSPMMSRGLRTLGHRPSLFEGAAISAVPLVGDVRITYHYPGYTAAGPAHGRRIDRRRRRGQGHARSHRDAPAARGAPRAAPARRDRREGRDRGVAVG